VFDVEPTEEIAVEVLAMETEMACGDVRLIISNTHGIDRVAGFLGQRC
jgi:hypothetical protein